MNLPLGKKKKHDFTPETTRAWTLALYPAIIVGVIIFMIVTNRPINTEAIGLFIGLLTAGSLQVAIKKNGDKSDNDFNALDPSSDIHSSSPSKLEQGNRSGTDDSDPWDDRNLSLWGYEVGGLSI